MAEHSYVVGGAPRDFLLGHGIKDLDLVVEASNGRTAEMLALNIAAQIGTHCQPDRYGVCHVGPFPKFSHLGVNLEGQKLEIVGARSEKYDRTQQHGSHKPVSVAPGTIVQDLERRDFTINTLTWRLSDLLRGPEKAPVLDLLGKGIEDLRGGVIRTPMDADETFSDDPSRMLRAVRFSVKYGFALDGLCHDAIVCNAGELRRLPGDVVESVFVDKILTMSGDRVAWALALMEELELVYVVKAKSAPARVRRGVMAHVTDPVALLRLAHYGFDVGFPVKREHVEKLSELRARMPSEDFRDLFERFRRPLDTAAYMAATGASGRAVGEAVEQAKGLVLLGMGPEEIHMALVRLQTG